jgi:hypothetical protein
MFFKITATTQANTSAFAAAIRAELAQVFPHADISIRPIYAPSGARMRLIETNCETPSVVENVETLCDMATDWVLAA